MSSSKSNRRSERMVTSLPVRWLLRSGSVDCVASDVNADGLFLRTDVSAMPGALMQLELRLPTGPITVFGVARFVGNTLAGAGIGIELFMMGPPERRSWLGFYRSLIGQPAAVRA